MFINWKFYFHFFFSPQKQQKNSTNSLKMKKKKKKKKAACIRWSVQCVLSVWSMNRCLFLSFFYLSRLAYDNLYFRPIKIKHFVCILNIDSHTHTAIDSAELPSTPLPCCRRRHKMTLNVLKWNAHGFWIKKHAHTNNRHIQEKKRENEEKTTPIRYNLHTRKWKENQC